MKISLCDLDFNITCTCHGKAKCPTLGDNAFHNFYTIAVERNNTIITFNFYDSIYNTEKGKKLHTLDDMLHAFNCFLLDSIAYYDFPTLVDFIENFGYDSEDIKMAKKVFDGCKSNYNKCMEIMDNQTMIDINTYLSENGYD